MRLQYTCLWIWRFFSHPLIPKHLLLLFFFLQGFKCINCKLMVHKKCHKAIKLQCDRKGETGGYDNPALNGNSVIQSDEGGDSRLNLHLARTGTGPRGPRRILQEVNALAYTIRCFGGASIIFRQKLFIWHDIDYCCDLSTLPALTEENVNVRWILIRKFFAGKMF